MLQLELLAGKRRIRFFDELNSILSSMPAGEKLVTSMHVLGLGKL